MNFKWPPKIKLDLESESLQGRKYRDHLNKNWNVFNWFSYQVIGAWSDFWSMLNDRLDDQNDKISEISSRLTSQATQNTNDNEVVDARTNAVGTTFDSIGERLNSDIYSKENIDTILEFNPDRLSFLQDYNVKGVSSSLSSFADAINADSGVAKILFLTDAHYGKGTNDAGTFAVYPYEDYLDAPPLSIEMLKNMNSFNGVVDCAVLNGDNAHGHEGHDINALRNKQTASTFRNALSGTDTFISIGNHDDGSVFYKAKETALTMAELLSIYDFDNFSFGETREGFAAYKDYSDHNLRVLVIDSFENPEIYEADGSTIKYPRGSHSVFSQTQLNFVASTLASLPNGYHVVIFSHCPLEGYFGNTPYADDYNVNHDVLNGILQAFANRTSYSGTGINSDYPASISVNFGSTTGSLVGVICGHQHRDIAVQEINGVKSVERTCFLAADRGDSSEPTYTTEDMLGTLNQYAFDVIEIDTSNRKVTFKRFGIGSDYSYGY